MEEFKGCDELRKWLVENGFRILRDRGAEKNCNWFAYRNTELPARRCEVDEDRHMQIIVKPYDGKRIVVNVEVSGVVDGLLFNLNHYTINPDGLPEKLDAVERMLISAWNALEAEKTNTLLGTFRKLWRDIKRAVDQYQYRLTAMLWR